MNAGEATPTAARVESDILAMKHHHTALSVPDLEASIGWYQRMLGFEIEERFHVAVVPANAAFLRRGPLRIELFEVAGAAPLPVERRRPDTDWRTHGNKHSCYAVRDVAAVHKTLHDRGADIAWFEARPSRSFLFVRDNAGMLIEFIEEPELWD